MEPFADLGLTLRRPTLDDLPAAVDFLVMLDRLEYGEADTDLDETRDFWRLQDLANDHWLLTDASGTVVGYGEVSRHRAVQIEPWVAAHPDWRGRGIGTRLADLAETRAAELVARAPDGTRVSMRAWVNARSEVARAFVGARGYEPLRRFWRMEIRMDDDPPAGPAWPHGVSVRAFDLERDAAATYEVVEEAFGDHWGHVRATFDEWMKRTEGETFDPALWWLAIAGDEIVGTALCSAYLDLGWIGTLGVRRAWRGRGLGEALLRHAFVEFHRRGRRRVALGVDSESLTGATRLYERAGMSVAREHELWTKVLREGRALEDEG